MGSCSSKTVASSSPGAPTERCSAQCAKSPGDCACGCSQLRAVRHSIRRRSRRSASDAVIAQGAVAMFIAYIIIAAVLALLLLVSAAFKLRPDPRRHESGARPRDRRRPEAVLPASRRPRDRGRGRSLVGLAWAPLGIAAAGGVVLYMI